MGLLAAMDFLDSPGLVAGLSGLVSLVVTAVLVPFAARAGRSWGAMDEPNHRKVHEFPTPRTGGLAIAAGLVAGLLTAFALGAFEPLSPRILSSGGIVAGALAVFAVGLAEDVRGVSVRLRFGVQLVAAIVVVSQGNWFRSISWPFGDSIDIGLLGAVIAVIWIVGITNAINLMDGLDGLAGGVAAIVAGSFVVFASIQAQSVSMAVAACLCGAAVGFLPHNWNPARIFLGDAGSLTIGFILATLALTTSLKSSTLVAVLVPVLALGVPAIDTLLVMVVRYLESPGHPTLRRLGRMFEADRTHLHHLVLVLARRRGSVVLVLLGLVTTCCLLAIVVSLSGSLTMALAILIVEGIAIALIRQTGIRARAQALTLAKRRVLREELGIDGDDDASDLVLGGESSVDQATA